jgi:ADP-ribose pyrophosphatase YjhB (NUDIX family)
MLRSLVGPERLIVPSAAAFIRDEAGRILLMQRPDNGAWHPPGGFMELGESVAETVVREASEETGLIVEPIRIIGVYSGQNNQWTYLNGDAIQGCATVFECRVTGGQLRAQASEVSALDYFPPEALPESLTPRWRPRLIEAAANLPQAVFQ